MTTEYETLTEWLNSDDAEYWFEGGYAMEIMGHGLRNDDETRVILNVTPATERTKRYSTPLLDAVKDYLTELEDFLIEPCDSLWMEADPRDDILKITFYFRRN